jgi:TetR/AcrR family transcriptional repressor of mexJK operon
VNNAERIRIVMVYPAGMAKPTRGRPSDPAKDRAILEAGRALLFDSGPQAVTMEAVARSAGIAKPTLYRRYGNRNELLAAIALAQSEHMAARFRLTPDNADDLRRALVEFGCDLTRFLLSGEHVQFIHALGASAGLSDADLRSIFHNGPMATRDQLAEWLHRAGGNGLLDVGDPVDCAERLLGTLMGLELVRMLYRVTPASGPAALERRVESIVDDFLALHLERR